MRSPATGVTSLMPTGRPHSRPGSSPRASRRSSSRASSIARGLSVTTALSVRIETLDTRKTGADDLATDACRAAITPRSSVADRSARSRHGFQSPVNATRAAERRLAAFELPREAAEDQPLVLQLGRVDVAAEVLDVHAVLREQRVVRQLVRRVREQLRRRLPARRTCPRTACARDRSGRTCPCRGSGRSAGSSDDRWRRSRRPRCESPSRAATAPCRDARQDGDGCTSPRPAREPNCACLCQPGVQEQQIALLHLDAIFDHLRRVDRRARPSRRTD